MSKGEEIAREFGREPGWEPWMAKLAERIDAALAEEREKVREWARKNGTPDSELDSNDPRRWVNVGALLAFLDTLGGKP